jgi:hypothetical protein
MRSDPLSPADVLRALELFGPQARPYNFDDGFDCWGLVRKVFDRLDDGYEIDEQLGRAGDGREANWAPVERRSDLVPGDLLTTHAHADDAFHTVFYCGRAGGLDLVYDSSPRGLVPLLEERGGEFRLAADRSLFTRYMRATETTDRLRHDGGAYLRLWDERQRFYNRAVHARLVAGGAAERDLAAPPGSPRYRSTAAAGCPVTPPGVRSTTTGAHATSTTTSPTARRCRTTCTKPSWSAARRRRARRARRRRGSRGRRTGWSGAVP